MIDKKLLIRLFIVLTYLGVMYSCTKCTMFKLSENVEIEQEQTTHKYNPPVGVANVIKVEKQVKKRAIKNQWVDLS